MNGKDNQNNEKGQGKLYTLRELIKYPPEFFADKIFCLDNSNPSIA